MIAGSLFRVVGIKKITVWMNDASNDFRIVSHLYPGDCFVLLKSNPNNVAADFHEVLVPKEGKRGFIGGLTRAVTNKSIEEVQTGIEEQ
jgi:hypothetical protein